jgi:hypothetical protein
MTRSDKPKEEKQVVGRGYFEVSFRIEQTAATIALIIENTKVHTVEETK